MPREHLTPYIVVRLVRLSENKGVVAELESRLNERDHERAARYRFADDRARFILGRGLLAKLLRHYLGHETINLDYTEHGRPFLSHDSAVHFSISHSRDLITVALADETLVGVDVECMARELHMDDIAERIFSAADLKKFQTLSAEEARPAFFRAWTGKEAYLKAHGIGISGGLQEVSVPFGDENPPVDAHDPWRLQPLPVPADYQGHVAWNDPRKTLDFREIKMSDTP